MTPGLYFVDLCSSCGLPQSHFWERKSFPPKFRELLYSPKRKSQRLITLFHKAVSVTTSGFFDSFPVEMLFFLLSISELSALKHLIQIHLY